MKDVVFFTKLAMSTSLSIPGIPRIYINIKLLMIKFSNFEAALFNDKVISSKKVDRLL